MWDGVVWHGMAWRGEAWCGVVWRGVEWPDVGMAWFAGQADSNEERYASSLACLLSIRLARAKEVHFGHMLCFQHPYLHHSLRRQDVF